MPIYNLKGSFSIHLKHSSSFKFFVNMHISIYFRRIDQLPIINSTHDHVIMQLAIIHDYK